MISAGHRDQSSHYHLSPEGGRRTLEGIAWLSEGTEGESSLTEFERGLGLWKIDYL